MKKQINYPRLIPRLFASTIDLFLLSVISSPIMNIISKYVFIRIFFDFITANNIDPKKITSITEISKLPDFVSFATTNNNGLSYFLIVLFCNIAIMGGYFIGSWICLSATPGKLIMSTRIVDSNTLEKPSNVQFIKRFLSYSLFFIGIWFVLFSKQRQALHDKIAGTLVIKK